MSTNPSNVYLINVRKSIRAAITPRLKAFQWPIGPQIATKQLIRSISNLNSPTILTIRLSPPPVHARPNLSPFHFLFLSLPRNLGLKKEKKMSEMCDIPTHFDFLEVFRCFVTKCYACERATDIVSAVIVSVEKCGEIQT